MADPGVALLVINFGEPETPSHDEVRAFLERIFLRNADLESGDGDRARRRAEELAERRAPGLVAEYEAIGGSPLNLQAREQADAIGRELGNRGRPVTVYHAFQFTPPLIPEVVRQVHEEGAETMIVLPAYPICGRSTTVAALDDVATAVDSLDGQPRLVGISGWHHPARYAEVRAANIRRFVGERGLDLTNSDTVLYFSAHGTPISYLEAGNRYDRYVHELCRSVAEGAAARHWVVGFQNHSNRGVPWTTPENEHRIAEIRERVLVVDAVSFIHEQSETLFELDVELQAFAGARDKTFHRVPVPTLDPLLIEVMADVAEEALLGGACLVPCLCRPGSLCTNGDRDLPPSPYGPGVAGPWTGSS